MIEIDRRSALTLALTAASTFTVPNAVHAMSGTSGGGGTAGAAGAPATTEAQGREVAPGVRRIEHSKRESVMPTYKTVSMRDNVYQPGAKSTSATMANDMVCHMLEGELAINQGAGMEFVVKKGDVWTCMKGMPENAHNTGSTVAIMRVIDLFA